MNGRFNIKYQNLKMSSTLYPYDYQMFRNINDFTLIENPSTWLAKLIVEKEKCECELRNSTDFTYRFASQHVKNQMIWNRMQRSPYFANLFENKFN